jgi:MFS family permease
MKLHSNTGPFVIASGAILGICAGLLWTAQGSLMLAYPTENQKGRFIGIFWSIFNMGGIVGSAVSLGTNFRSEVRMSSCQSNGGAQSRSSLWFKGQFR